MKRVTAIAALTFSEGVRLRMVLVFLIVLVFLTLRMPFALRGDATLTGRLQNFLAYSLAAMSVLLSLATVFFACTTLTREFRERSLHMVVTKPVSRFAILLGKWLGVNLLNVLIIALCGGAIYGFAVFLKARPETFARDRMQLRDVVWTARVAAGPVFPKEAAEREVESYVRGLLRSGAIEPGQETPARARRMSELENQWSSIPPGEVRIYEFKGLAPPEREDAVMQVRYKVRANPPPPGEMVPLAWTFLDPQTGNPLHPPMLTRERSGYTHHLLVRTAAAVYDGRAVLLVENPFDEEHPTSVFFEGSPGIEVLYKVSSFEDNYLRALLLVLLRLLLISAVGLFFSVFVSFPVACLCTGTFYLLCLGMPFWLESIGANDAALTRQYDPYGMFGPAVRALLVPVLRVAFPDFVQYEGARYLVDGTLIPNNLLLAGIVHTFLYGTVLLLGVGWLIFRRREVAEVMVEG